MRLSHMHQNRGGNTDHIGDILPHVSFFFNECYEEHYGHSILLIFINHINPLDGP
jgi:hypothetical protein